MPQTLLNLRILVENKIFQNCQNSIQATHMQKPKGERKKKTKLLLMYKTQKYWILSDMVTELELVEFVTEKFFFLSITLYFSLLNVISGPHQS